MCPGDTVAYTCTVEDNPVATISWEVCCLNSAVNSAGSCFNYENMLPDRLTSDVNDPMSRTRSICRSEGAENSSFILQYNAMRRIEQQQVTYLTISVPRQLQNINKLRINCENSGNNRYLQVTGENNKS